MQNYFIAKGLSVENDLQLADGYLQQGFLEEAKEIYSHVIKYKKDLPRALHGLCHCEIQHQLIKFSLNCYARKYFIKAINTAKTIPAWEKNKFALLIISESYMSSGQEKLARAYLNILVSQFHNDEDAIRLLCKLVVKTNAEDAEKILEGASQHFPSEMVYLFQVEYYVKINNITRALEISQKFLEKYPACKENYLNLIHFSFLLKNTRQAIDYIERCHKIFPTDANLYYKINILINLFPSQTLTASSIVSHGVFRRIAGPPGCSPWESGVSPQYFTYTFCKKQKDGRVSPVEIQERHLALTETLSLRALDLATSTPRLGKI